MRCKTLAELRKKIKARRTFVKAGGFYVGMDQLLFSPNTVMKLFDDILKEIPEGEVKLPKPDKSPCPLWWEKQDK